MVSMGFVAALPFTAYGHYAILHDLALGPLALALGGSGWVGFIGISGYLLLLFPDGHLPSRRWRWFAWLCGIGMASLAAFIWVYPGSFTDSGFPQVENPIGIDALEPLLDVSTPLTFFAPLLVLGGAAGLVVRLRRSTDDVTRHQIRWLTWAASWIAFLFFVSFLPGAGDAAWSSGIQTLAVFSFVLIPITIGIAVLRYRLYDIDIVIRKTVVIAVMIVAIAIVYVGVVAGVGALVGASGSPLLSALAAAIVALVLQPVRARARRFADRVVYGKRATPYEVMSTFGDQLAGTYAADDVLPRTARVLGEGVGAERAEVRMAFGDEMRPVAVWPVDAPICPTITWPRFVTRAISSAPSRSRFPANDPIDATREQLVQDLAAQAGLVLRNERLAQQLRARLADLPAAQKRLVTAQDEERRKLERNIHDGAQQQLVALQCRQRLAEQLVERDPAKAKEMLEQLQIETGRALDDLRDLARGIYPPLLADKGLVAALEAQSRRAPLPVIVGSEGTTRYPQDRGCRVLLRARDDAEHLEIHPGQHGIGAAGRGGRDARVQGHRRWGWVRSRLDRLWHRTTRRPDRLGALDGDLRIESTPGEGTTVVGRVPLVGREDASEGVREEVTV